MQGSVVSRGKKTRHMIFGFSSTSNNCQLYDNSSFDNYLIVLEKEIWGTVEVKD
jgi:hypothetical protein